MKVNIENACKRGNASTHQWVLEELVRNQGAEVMSAKARVLAARPGAWSQRWGQWWWVVCWRDADKARVFLSSEQPTARKAWEDAATKYGKKP